MVSLKVWTFLHLLFGVGVGGGGKRVGEGEEKNTSER